MSFLKDPDIWEAVSRIGTSTASKAAISGAKVGAIGGAALSVALDLPVAITKLPLIYAFPWLAESAIIGAVPGAVVGATGGLVAKGAQFLYQNREPIMDFLQSQAQDIGEQAGDMTSMAHYMIRNYSPTDMINQATEPINNLKQSIIDYSSGIKQGASAGVNEAKSSILADIDVGMQSLQVKLPRITDQDTADFLSKEIKIWNSIPIEEKGNIPIMQVIHMKNQMFLNHLLLKMKYGIPFDPTAGE